MGEKEPESGEDFSIEDPIQPDEPDIIKIKKPYIPYFSAKRRWKKIRIPLEAEQQDQDKKGE